MPDRRAHLRQAQHNRLLIRALDPASTQFLDWVVTVAFYTALHKIEAWFADKGRHFESHDQRDDWMSKVKEFRRIVYPAYKELEFQSRQARYRCVGFHRDFVQDEILTSLDRVENELDRLL